MPALTRRQLFSLSGMSLGLLACAGCGGSESVLNPALAQLPAPPPEPLGTFIPGEPLASDELRVSFMGTSFLPRRAQQCNSIFVEVGNGDNFVFDCGSGVSANYVAMGVPYSKMDKIFLTHLHADHTSDLVTIYAFGPSQDRKTPLHVYGPDGDRPEYGTRYFCERMHEMLRWHIDGFSFLPTGLVGQGDGYDIEVHELPYLKFGGVAYDSNGVRITHFPSVHDKDGSIGYKLEWNGLSMIFTGDTLPNTWSIEAGRNVDLFIHEMVVPATTWATKNSGLKPGDPGYEDAVNYAQTVQDSSHTPQKALGYILSQAQPRLGVATHFQVNEDTVGPALEDVRRWYGGPFTLATDLLVINVSRSQIRQRRAVVSDYAWYPAPRIYPQSELAPPRYPSPTAQLNNLLLSHVIPQSVYDPPAVKRS